MHLFPSRKNRVIPTLAQSIPPPRQNLYSAYNRLIPSPPPPPFIEGNGSAYHKSIIEKYSKDDDDIEKYNHKKMMLEEAERNEKLNRISYSRILCCFCFPCLPMWTRTICCFLFLAICCIIGIVVFFVLSFKKPQIVFIGNNNSASNSQLSSTSAPVKDLHFVYSVYNGNFFQFDFDSIKAVIYYPTPNIVGVGEISNIVLGPQAITNITFPVKLVSSADGSYKQSNSTLEPEEEGSGEAFKSMVVSSCNSISEGSNDSAHHNNKEIVVLFDLMPTIRIYNYPIVTLAFTGQKTVMSCEKLNSFIENTKKTPV